MIKRLLCYLFRHRTKKNNPHKAIIRWERQLYSLWRPHYLCHRCGRWVCLLLTILLTSTICYALTPAQTAVMRNWLDPNGVSDFTGDGVCNFQDFALAAGRKRDFMNKAVIWGKWQGTDANNHSTSHKVCLQNFAVYIAESNSIVKVNRTQRTIELQALYAQLWMEWGL